jgi:predicted metalloprotease
VQDVRGSGGGGGFRLPGGFGRGGGINLPGGGGPAIRRAGGGGIGLIIVLVIVALLFGINPMELLGGGGGPVVTGPGQQQTTGGLEASDEARDFVATVLADTEDTWNRIFESNGLDYREPTLVLFSDQVNSACGFASAASGPFYCPGDEKAYIDLSFYDLLRQRFDAPGDFAQAYVLAHEIGHHVQNLIGVLPRFHQMRQNMSEREANAMSVRVELQADCFAGVWAHHTAQQGLLEEGDIDEALNAATQIGDDTLQKRSQGYVVPESFNHGTSAQRSTWFKRGFDSGKLSACDTFNSDI